MILKCWNCDSDFHAQDWQERGIIEFGHAVDSYLCMACIATALEDPDKEVNLGVDGDYVRSSSCQCYTDYTCKHESSEFPLIPLMDYQWPRIVKLIMPNGKSFNPLRESYPFEISPPS
jgi:hypothetical protein